MPYKYIGRKTDFKGKTLWEILGNLKDFGVGRIIARSMFERYPEPSYFKILKVQPLPCPENQNIDNVRKVRVLAERTFRGKTFTKYVTIESASYKADFKLIPKGEEEEYCHKHSLTNEQIPILPKYTEFPPLMKELLIKEMQKNNEKFEGEPKLEIVYNKKNYGKYHIAEEGEKPTVNFNYDIKNSPYKSLYANIKAS